MRIVTLVENSCGNENCIAEHGISIYIETEKHTLRRLCVKVFLSVVQIQRKIANLSIFWNYFPSLIAACVVDREQ